MYARAHTRTRLVNISTIDHKLRIITYYTLSYNGGRKNFQMNNRPPIDHLSISIPAYTFSPFNTILFLLDNNRSIAIYDRPYCSLYLYNVTQHFTKHWKILILNIGKHFYQRLENTFIDVGKHFYQTLDNTFIKHWKTLLSNVGKHFCQTLDNT